MEDLLAGYQHRFHELVERCYQSASSLFHLAFCSFLFFFVDVLFVYALDYAVITSLLMPWCFHVLPDLSQLSFYTFDLFYI